MIADASCRLVAGESFQIFDSKAMVACCQYYVAVHKTLQFSDISCHKKIIADQNYCLERPASGKMTI